MSEADAKYRKLATEYAKLKAQLPVLRKAIVDEQQKETALKDEIREKDQCIRKSEQELESLLFRNEQLSKRVSVLQEELDKNATSSKHRRGRADTGGEPASHANTSILLNEELQRKIRENEILHTELNNVKEDTSRQMMQLKDKVDSHEFSERQYSTAIQKIEAESRAQIDKLREEKALLEVRLENQERSVREAKLSASLSEDRLQNTEKVLSTKLALAKKVIDERIPYNDTKNPALNSYNVPTHSRYQQMQVAKQLKYINGHIRELCEHLSSVFTYLEQRYHVSPSPSTSNSSAVKTQLCAHLRTAPSILKILADSFAKFIETQPADVVLTLDTAIGLRPFIERCEIFNSFLKKLIPYFSLSMKEENLRSFSTQTMCNQNEKTILALEQFSNSLDRNCTYLQLISAQSGRGYNFPKSNQVKILHLLSKSVSQLQLSGKDSGIWPAMKGLPVGSITVGSHISPTITRALGVAFHMKSELETQLPTAPEALTTTDQCLLKSLVSTNGTLSRLSAYVTEHYECRSGVSPPLLASNSAKHDPIVTQLQSQSATYLRLIHRSVAPSVPYSRALENMKTLFRSTESRESLHEQVTKLNSKVSKLEQEKERWMLDAQLLRIKYEKQQKSISLESSAEKSEEMTSSGSSIAAGAVTAPTDYDTRELGSIEGKPNDRSDTSDDSTRESLLRLHLSNRIDDLTAQLQHADSNAVAVHAECRALGRRLNIATKAKLKAQEQLSEANTTVSHLQDELLTTKKSYDSQLMTMSEALASMNGNLASQQDEIEELKQQLKIARKGKK